MVYQWGFAKEESTWFVRTDVVRSIEWSLLLLLLLPNGSITLILLADASIKRPLTRGTVGIRLDTDQDYEVAR